MTSSDPHFKEPRMQQFRALVYLARGDSFSRAGEQLGLSRSSVWRQIRALENDTGTPLVLLEGRKVRITDSGRLLLQIVAPIIDAFEKALPDFHERRTRATLKLSIAAIPMLLLYELPPVIQRMKLKYPDLNVSISSVTSGDALQSLQNGEVNVAIVGYMDQVRADGTLGGYPLMDYPPVLLVPMDHPLVHRKQVTIEDLADLPLILPPPTSSTRARVQNAFAQSGLSDRQNVIMDVNLFTLGVAFVRMGIGLAILSVSPLCLRGELAAAAERNELTIIDVTHLFGVEKIFFVTKRNRESLKHLEEFRILLEESCTAIS